MDGILANAVFPSASIVVVTLHGRQSTYLYTYITQPFYINLTSHLKNIIHPKASNIFEVLLKFFLLSHLSVFVTKKDFFSHVWVGGYVRTSEMAKLREKGQTMFSNGSSLTNAESSRRVQAKEEEESSTGLVLTFSRFM